MHIAVLHAFKLYTEPAVDPDPPTLRQTPVLSGDWQILAEIPDFGDSHLSDRHPNASSKRARARPQATHY